MLFDAIRLRTAFASLALASLGASAQARETLNLLGLDANTNVTWSKNSGFSYENSGSGAFHGVYNDGTDHAVDPLYCIDLEGWVSLPSGLFTVTRTQTFTAAGWLVGAYGDAAKGNATLGTALQLALWNLKYDTDLNVTTGKFQVGDGAFSVTSAVYNQANAYLSSIGNHKWYAYEYTRVLPDGAGQSQIGLTDRTFNISSVPGPVGGLVFLGGLLRRRRRS